ncbi:MAG: histidine kinase [Ignavibacteriaceae bacterium]|jgi:sensor histidine kinase YesM
MFTNPILSKKINVFLYFLVWFFTSALYLVIVEVVLKINIDVAAVDLIFTFLLFGIGIFLWYPSCFLTLENYKPSKIFISHILGGIFSTFLWLMIGYFIIVSVLPPSHGFIDFFNNTLIWRFLTGLMFYLLLISFYYIIIYYRTLQEKISNEAELKNSITEAELKTLKFQINPHFIFNSLNSMSALTSIDAERARSMILKLADFLRYTLANNEKEKTLLGEELKNIRLYLEIEKIRFEDKFEYIEELERDTLDMLIPNMILQPLFENVIKHAVYESLSKVTLYLKCSIKESFLFISIENDFEPGFSTPKGTGIGLQNVKRRLELIYGLPHLLEVTKKNNHFKVSILIPQ